MHRDLLIISGIFPPETGGPAKFSADFASWCASNGNKVSVITYRNDSNQLNLPDLDYNVVPALKSASLIKTYILMINTIRRNVTMDVPILAVGAFLETYFASLMYKFKYVVKVPGDIVWERARNNRVTNLDIASFQTAKLPLKYKIYRFLYTHSLVRASLVIVPSKGLRDLCIMWGVQEEKISLIYNSVNIEKYLTLAHTKKVFDVLTVCRLVPWKGVDEVIQYCSVRGLKLAIAGDGPERFSLESLAESNQAKVSFLGNIPEEEVLNVMGKSKVFVLNSSYEGLPHALIEARAASLISVARGGTGSAEVIHDDVDGFLVRRDRNFTETMDLALSSADQASEFGLFASLDAKNRFDREQNFQRIFNTITTVYG
jgi:glycosyltransferase involved in cell wall biosynthesis